MFNCVFEVLFRYYFLAFSHLLKFDFTARRRHYASDDKRRSGPGGRRDARDKHEPPQGGSPDVSIAPQPNEPEHSERSHETTNEPERPYPTVPNGRCCRRGTSHHQHALDRQTLPAVHPGKEGQLRLEAAEGDEPQERALQDRPREVQRALVGVLLSGRGREHSGSVSVREAAKDAAVLAVPQRERHRPEGAGGGGRDQSTGRDARK